MTSQGKHFEDAESLLRQGRFANVSLVQVPWGVKNAAVQKPHKGGDERGGENSECALAATTRLQVIDTTQKYLEVCRLRSVS